MDATGSKFFAVRHLIIVVMKQADVGLFLKVFRPIIELVSYDLEKAESKYIIIV